MYTHLQRLQHLLFDPAFTLQFPLVPGMLIAIDNWRVMHGRLPFDESSGRALGGCYMPEEETRVRREALRARFGGAGWLEGLVSEAAAGKQLSAHGHQLLRA